MIEYLPLKEINRSHQTEILKALHETAVSGWYLRGEATHRFQDKYAKYIGTEHCIACGNGYDALWLMLKAALEIGYLQPGDQILVPANTFIATILAISDCQLQPILIEPHHATAQIDERLIEQAITARTRAIMLVHLYGRCAFTTEIARICKKHGLLLFEDNAQAHGCTAENGQRTGSLGLAAAHSFYPGKNLGALGDAGAVTTSDTTLAHMVETLGNYGAEKKYIHLQRGRNSRMDEIQAAMLSEKLAYLETDNALRKSIARKYEQQINHPLIRLSQNFGRDNVYHIFPLFCTERDALKEYLFQKGIDTAIHYPIPAHLQACYPQWHTLSLPVTEDLAKTELSIPCHPALTAADTDYIIRTINNWAK